MVVCDPWSVVCGPWSVLRGSVVRDPWSVVRDPWSVVRGPWSPHVRLMSGYVPIWHRIPPGLVEDTKVVIGCVFVNNSIDILVVKSPAVPLKTILLVEDAD